MPAKVVLTDYVSRRAALAKPLQLRKLSCNQAVMPAGLVSMAGITGTSRVASRTGAVEGDK
jgi:hypothetical protein